jgi:hypothetical protein
MTGAGGSPGGTYYLVSSTNVAASLASWIRVATNVLAPDGGFTNSIPINPGVPRSFFRVQVP